MTRTKPAQRVRRYSAEDIHVSSDIEGVRGHVGMYLGNVNHLASLQCFVEFLQNAVDETREIGGGVVRVVFDPLESGHFRITVADRGRGIPVERHATTGVSTLETVLTRLHAGGKSGKKTAYGKRTVGVHGVGAAASNACSSRLDVWTYRANAWHHMAFERGVRVSHERDATPPFAWQRGTIVRFVIDTTVIPESLRLVDARRVCGLVRYWDPITIQYRDPERTSTLTPREPVDLLRGVVARNDARILAGPVVVRDNGVQAVVAWTNLPGSEIVASVAGAPVPTGTHVRGLELAVADAMSQRGLSVGTAGLVAVLDVSVDRPSFSGQAKQSLRTGEVTARVREALTRPLQRYLRANPSEATAAREHARHIDGINAQAEERRNLARDASRAKTGRHSLPVGFKSATAFRPEQRELFLLEGKCLTGDTRVLLADGTSASMDQLRVENAAGWSPRVGLSVDPVTGTARETRLLHPRLTKHVRDLVEVELSDGTIVRCTPDHQWLLADGTYRPADGLLPGDVPMSVQEPGAADRSREDERGS